MNDVRLQLFDLILHLLPEDLAKENRPAEDVQTDGPDLKSLFVEGLVEAICAEFDVAPRKGSMKSARAKNAITVEEETANAERIATPKPSGIRYTYDSMDRLIHKEPE